jgi:uncharacterized membrane protein
MGMDILYVMAVWIHILTVAIWIGAMFFSDPNSIRIASRLAEKYHGVGWYAQAVLWTTGLFMLQYRGVSLRTLFSADFISSSWGRTVWAKLLLVLVLLAFQIVVGHKPSKLVYGYILVAFVVVALSVLIVRPVITF